MKIIQQNAGLLSNHEVAQVLKERGADPSAGLNTRAKASEKTVYQYLTTQAGSIKPKEQLTAFINELEPFSLTRAELVQVINLSPSSAVEVHLIVEDCEERFNEDQVEQIISIVEKHLKSSTAADAMQE